MINSVVFRVQVAIRGDEALGKGTPPRTAGAMMSQGSIRRGCELPKQMHSPGLVLFHIDTPNISIYIYIYRSISRSHYTIKTSLVIYDHFIINVNMWSKV